MQLQKKNEEPCSECATRGRCLMSVVPDCELPLVGRHIRPLQFRRGEEIYAQGEAPKAIRIVKVGQVVGMHESASHARPVIIAGRGSPIGLFRLFGRPVGLGAVANSSVYICEIPVAVLKRLPSWDGPLKERAISMAFNHFHNLASWSVALRRESTAARMAACLVLLYRNSNQSHISMPSTVLWSKIVGAARETVSRALARLEAQNCFLRDGRMIKVDVDRCIRLYRLPTNLTILD